MKFGGLPLGQFSSKLLDLIKFGRGSGYDSTQFLRSDGRRGWKLAPLTKSGAIITLTAGTAYTPTVGTKAIWIRLVGGGGGGAGAKAAVSQCSIGGSGGGGAYLEKFINNIGAGPFTYAIGAAGAAGTNAPTAGGAGGNTTFNDGVTLYTAGGGAGGTVMTSGTVAAATADGAGGTATNGDLNIVGQNNVAQGLRQSGTVGYKSMGGNPPLGWGSGTTRMLILFNSNINGESFGQSGFGGGGQGAQSFNATGQAGSAGLAGVLVIMEFA